MRYEKQINLKRVKDSNLKCLKRNIEVGNELGTLDGPYIAIWNTRYRLALEHWEL